MAMIPIKALERERAHTPFIVHLRHALALPFKFLVFEPIVLFFSLYMTMIYIGKSVCWIVARTRMTLN